MTAVASTSLRAYDALKAGKLGSQQQRVLAHMLERCDRDFTRQELVQSTGLAINAMCGRVKELLDAGLLEVAGTRTCTVTGNTVEALRLAPAQQSLDLAA